MGKRQGKMICNLRDHGAIQQGTLSLGFAPGVSRVYQFFSSPYQVRDKHETDDGLRRRTVVISEYTGVLRNDDGVSFTYRNLT